LGAPRGQKSRGKGIDLAIEAGKRESSQEISTSPLFPFSHDLERGLSDIGQSDDAACLHFKARLDKKIGVCFSQLSGHAPHFLSARKFSFKSFNVLVDPENNLHGVTSPGLLPQRLSKSESMPVIQQEAFQKPIAIKKYRSLKWLYPVADRRSRKDSKVLLMG